MAKQAERSVLPAFSLFLSFGQAKERKTKRQPS